MALWLGTLTGLCPSTQLPTGAGVIYGEDNRRDVCDESNSTELIKAARAVGLVVESDKLQLRSTTTTDVRLKAQTLKDHHKVCTEEPFAKQPSAGGCTAFLVSQNLMVTAAHCIPTVEACSRTSIVFDYQIDSADRDPTLLSSDAIYQCQALLARDITPNGDELGGEDYLVFSVDRTVTGRDPLTWRSDGKVPADAPLAAIGFPSGLPLKIAAGAHVRSNVADGFFTATTDTYAGSSGSPVINLTTNKIEGVIARGETDYVKSGDCYMSKRCTEKECRGEDATRMTSIGPWIEAALKPAPATHTAVLPEVKIDRNIPDNDSRGVTGTINVTDSLPIYALSIRVKIKHPFPRDLVLTLVAPDGSKHILQNQEVDGLGQNMNKTFGAGGVPVNSFLALRSTQSKGTWLLTVADMIPDSSGELESAQITFLVSDAERK